MAISRMQEPRQMYGLGSLVKKATRAVKKVVKSPIGKAAILGGLTFGVPGTGFKGFLGKGGLGALKGKLLGLPGADEFGGTAGLLKKLGLTKGGYGSLGGLTGLGKIASIGGVSGLAGLLASQEEEDDIDFSDLDRGEGIDFSDVVRRARLQDPEFRFLPGSRFTSAYAAGGKVKPTRKRLVEIFKDSEIERELGPAKDFTTDELRDILFKMHGDQIYKPYKDGGDVEPKQPVKKMMVDKLEVQVMPNQSDERAVLDAMMNDIDEVMSEDRKREFYKLLIPQLRQSGEMSDSEYKGLMGELFGEGKAEGGIMNLGGNEMDLRGGGFVPLGAKEKADDVPARLSKNEFVFTADAVRAAGGGSVDKGADKMYKMMKSLEAQV